MSGGSGGGGKGGRTNGGGGGPEIMTYDQFAAKSGMEGPLSEHGAMRFPHGITERQQKKLSKTAAANLTKGMAQDAAARAAYNDAVRAGKVRPPTRNERLMETARGNPDNQSVQSARRILKKQGLSW